MDDEHTHEHPGIKRYYFNMNQQVIRQKLTMSGKTFKLGKLFQYMLLQNSIQHVLLNKVQDVYDRLKRQVYVLYGESKRREEEGLVGVRVVRNMAELQQVQYKFTEETRIVLFYRKFEIKSDELTNILAFSTKPNLKIKLQQIQQISQISQYIKQAKNILPTFSEISSDDKAKINKQKYNLYWMLGGQYFKKAKQDFLVFMRYFLEMQEGTKGEGYIQNQINKYAEAYQNLFRDAEREIKFYTGESCIHKILNNSLRSLVHPSDFAYIRFPFILTFYSVLELFVEQAEEKFRLEGFTCYRRLNLSDSQSEEFVKCKNKYIQMNGFLSTSINKMAITQFGKDLIEIRVPAMNSKSSKTNLFHSFANISKYSIYPFQEQILFNPLNIFKIVEIFDENQGKTILLDYIDREQMAMSKESKQQIDRNLIQNYQHQKQMLSLNRNQGQYFWRLQEKEAFLFYRQVFQKLMQIQSKSINLEEHKSQLQNKATPILYKQLLEFIPRFKWFEDKQQNLMLVDKFIIKNKHKCIGLYFYAAKMYQNQQKYQESFNFHIVCLTVSRQFIRKGSFLFYKLLTSMGIALINLEEFKNAKKCFNISYQYLQKKFSIFGNSFTFLVAPIILAYQTGNKEDENKLIELLKKFVEMKNKQSSTNAEPWLRFALNLDQISNLQEFYDYRARTFGKPYFLRRLKIYKVQEVFLQIEQEPDFFQLPMSSPLRKKLQISIYLMEIYSSHDCLELQTILTKQILLNLCQYLSQPTNVKHDQLSQVVQEWQKKYLCNQQIKNYHYCQFRFHLLSWKYILKIKSYLNLEKSHQTLAHFRFLQKIIRIKFKDSLYAHLVFLIILVQYCISQKDYESGRYFLPILLVLLEKMKNVLQLHRRQVAYLQNILK